ncbi:MAG: hypothetical protein ABS76_17365 [Pelagibacterium sp. SCN 64-44]|nr:MAG: hypothetical protein ABS76_17365 [Pelagibacterium sp. SCN 64-44]
MQRVTIQHIADHLGLSKFAVSRALAGKSGVSELTRQQVRGAAEALGYNVRSRAGAAAQTVAVIFKDRPTASRELWVDVQNGIDHEARENALRMSVHWDFSPADIRAMTESTAGLILVGPQLPEMLETALTSSLPAVVVNHIVPPLWPRDQISAADVEAGIAVAKYLHELGHRRVVYAHGRRGFPGRLARLNGFAEAISELGDMEVREIAFSDDRAAGDLREAVLDMAQAGFEPTAFFCGSDIVAVTITSELMRMGLRIPEDVSVIGHADYAIATQISPQLSTVRMPHKEMGIVAVRVMLARAGRSGFLANLPAQRLNLVPNLVERQSSGIATGTSWRHRLRDLTVTK